MAALPTGTVTFLFTDIEGSTELLASLGDGYRVVLERHNELMRSSLSRHGGVEVATEGDSFFEVFTDAPGAIHAAIEAQRALLSEQWTAGVTLRVRMGLHTGAGIAGADSYVGIDVHRAARISSAANGGQILLSDATRALTEQSLPEHASLRDLGSHRLKGLPAAEHIFQLVVDELPADFPAIGSLSVRPNNLPASLTSFVGRERQIAEIGERLASTRLLTMTGPAGTGKTRLSIRVAEEVLADYEHGCWFVALDALRDPDLVPSTIADTLGIRVPPDKPAMAAIESWLADRQLLLVLDNLEQIAEAAGHVTRLLAAAPGLRVLATSRVPLHVYGEQEYPVPPLASASELRAAGARDAQALSHYEAVRLFIERAVAVKPDFAVNNDNAPAVAQICARLDGLPLAIELAAARIKVLSPEQMLARLEQNLSSLASANRDVPERQRTLRGAIDWSHELLGEDERRLFARLSVFRGGFSLDATEHICGDGELGIDVLDGLSVLVDNSLVGTDVSAGETRFAMLETIREYAREKLAQSDDHDDLLRRHAAFFCKLASEQGPDLGGANTVGALERLQADRDNLRAAFDRAPQLGILNDALVAAGAMWRFWQLRGEFAEGRTVLERLLEFPDAEPRARADALTGAGGLAYWQRDYESMAGHYVAARELYEGLGDRRRLAESLYNEAFLSLVTGDTAAGRERLHRSIELYAQIGDESAAAGAEIFLGVTYLGSGEPETGLAHAQKAVDGYRTIGARWMIADGLAGLAALRAATGDWAGSMAAIRESLTIFNEMENEVGMEMALETIAALAAWAGEAELAARLMGKTDEMKERLGGGPPMILQGSASHREMALEKLGAAQFEQFHAAGAMLTTAEAVRLGEEFNVSPDTARFQASAEPLA